MDHKNLQIFKLIIFELKSLLWRKIVNPRPKLNAKKNYLNLGCGKAVEKKFINADFFPPFAFWNKTSQKPDWILDFRYPFNCPDNIWDGVFTEHTLEHLYPEVAINLLTEIYRTMKSGAILRITVPDLKLYIDFYNNPQSNDLDAFSNRFNTGAEALHHLTQMHGHLSTWDNTLLAKILRTIGFVNISTRSFNEGSDPQLLIDREERKWNTLYLEAQK